jgi:hypothetical protein
MLRCLSSQACMEGGSRFLMRWRRLGKGPLESNPTQWTSDPGSVDQAEDAARRAPECLPWWWSDGRCSIARVKKPHISFSLPAKEPRITYGTRVIEEGVPGGVRLNLSLSPSLPYLDRVNDKVWDLHGPETSSGVPVSSKPHAVLCRHCMYHLVHVWIENLVGWSGSILVAYVFGCRWNETESLLKWNIPLRCGTAPLL